MADNLNNILSNFFNENIKTNTTINSVILGLTTLIIIFLGIEEKTDIHKKPFFYILIMLLIASMTLLIYNKENLNKIDEDNRKNKVQSLIWSSVFTHIFFVFTTIIILLTLKFGKIPWISELFNTMLESLKIRFPIIDKLIPKIGYILIGVFLGVFGLIYGLSYKKQ